MSPMLPATIIVADTDLAMREVLVEVARFSGYRAFPARDGQDALVLLEDEPGPRVLLTDLHMPGPNGLVLAKHVIRAGVSIVLYTPTPRAATQVEARLLGAHRLLDKYRLSLEILTESLHAAANDAGMLTDPSTSGPSPLASAPDGALDGRLGCPAKPGQDT